MSTTLQDASADAKREKKQKQPIPPAERLLSDYLIPRREAFRQLGLGIGTGLRLERTDPTFPKAVAVKGRGNGSRGFFRASELVAWVAARPPNPLDPVKQANSREAVSKARAVAAKRARAEEPA